MSLGSILEPGKGAAGQGWKQFIVSWVWSSFTNQCWILYPDVKGVGGAIISALIPSCSAKFLPGSQLLPGACGGSSGPDKPTEITLLTKAVWQACQSEPCPGRQAPGFCVSRRWVHAPLGQDPSLCVEDRDAMLSLSCNGWLAPMDFRCVCEGKGWGVMFTSERRLRVGENT